MHPKYKELLATHYINASPHTISRMKYLYRKLPAPDELTREFVLDLITKYENPHTRHQVFKLMKVTLRLLDKSELLKGISITQPATSIKRGDLLTQSDISALLRASKTLLQRAIIELLTESGCRIGEALNLTKSDTEIQADFVIATFSGKTGTRQVPLLRDNLTPFLFQVATVESEVGDYDINVYAFEHLSNATYKRMFRSFDLKHTEVSDSSPYARNQLEGISGEFSRRIWDHAKHLITGTDLDQDELAELVITSDLQVYIYEATGIDDTIELAHIFDLRDLRYLDDESDTWKEVTEITTIEAGADSDSDGRRDLVVAVGPFLLVFNIDVDSFDGLEPNDFFGRSGDMEGRYYLLGNPEGADPYQGANIRSLAEMHIQRLSWIVSMTQGL